MGENRGVLGAAVTSARLRQRPQVPRTQSSSLLVPPTRSPGGHAGGAAVLLKPLQAVRFTPAFVEETDGPTNFSLA